MGKEEQWENKSICKLPCTNTVGTLLVLICSYTVFYHNSLSVNIVSFFRWQLAYHPYVIINIDCTCSTNWNGQRNNNICGAIKCHSQIWTGRRKLISSVTSNVPTRSVLKTLCD
jgi:hypothetical protein